MNYSITPKADLLKSEGRIKEHHKLVENEFLRDHLQTALLEYSKRQVALSAPDLGGCAACHLRLQGATEFVDLFLNLAEVASATARTDTTNLPSNVRSLPRKD